MGAHLSAAGGWHRAVEAALQLGCDAVQLFLRPPGRWAGPAVTGEKIGSFRQVVVGSPLEAAVFAHAPYLVNLASEDPELARRSLETVVEELDLAARLGIAGVVLHPGSAGTGSRNAAATRLRERLEEVLARAPAGPQLLLENTAGAGGLLASRVADIVELAPRSLWERERLGVCLDTAHLWAAGYDLLAGGWHQALGELAAAGLVPALRLVHINDTPVPRGSGRDRHVPPGEGQLGERFFAELLADPALSPVACIMEIPPGPGNREVRQALGRVRRWLP